MDLNCGGFIYKVKNNNKENIKKKNEIFTDTEILDESKIDKLLKKADFKNISDNINKPLILENSDDFINIFQTDLKNEKKQKMNNNLISKNIINNKKFNKKNINLFNPSKFYQNINITNCTKEQFLKSLISHTGTYLKHREGTEMYEKWTKEIILNNFFPIDLETEIKNIEKELKDIDEEVKELKDLFTENLKENLQFELEDHENNNIPFEISLNKIKETEILEIFSKKLDNLIKINEDKLSNKMLLIDNEISGLISPHHLIKKMCFKTDNEV